MVCCDVTKLRNEGTVCYLEKIKTKTRKSSMVMGTSSISTMQQIWFSKVWKTGSSLGLREDEDESEPQDGDWDEIRSDSVRGSWGVRRLEGRACTGLYYCTVMHCDSWTEIISRFPSS